MRLFFLFALLVAVPVSAQTIHGHPQKAAYASPAEYPFFSAQGHWAVNGVLAHTHVELACPVYAEVHANLVRATASTTTVILAGTFTASDKLAYICIGY